MTDREHRTAEANARAHNARAAIPPRDEPSRYDQLGPEARALVDDYDALDLAEMLVATKDDLAALRKVARGYCPACGRGDAAPTVQDWEQQKQRADEAEQRLARIVKGRPHGDAVQAEIGELITQTHELRDQLRHTEAAHAQTIDSMERAVRRARRAEAELAALRRRLLTLLSDHGITSHRLDLIRDAAQLHRQQLISTSELYAVIEALDGDQPGA